MRRSLPLLALLLALLPVRAAAEDVFADTPPGTYVDLWTRKAGSYVDGRDPGRLKHKRLALSRQTQRNVKRYDQQYQETREYRGVALLAVIEAYEPAPELDLVLLHFKNGMVIPVPLEDDFATLKQMNAFVAVAWREDAKKAWTAEFPEIGRLDEKFRDPVPVQFAANKLVLASGWHPWVRGKDFTPFMHADTLIGIEFAQRGAYEQQFVTSGDPTASPGYLVFHDRCQFCHGLRHVGASYGWDFLDPVPVYDLKQPNHLYYKVRYSYHDALQRGLRMPTQTTVTEDEMRDLWRWLRQTGNGKQPAYRP